MDKKRTYFPVTTAQQRRLLFETWEATGSVAEACQRAHVSERTFYNWKKRYEAGGYAALEETGSHAPKEPHRIAKAVADQVEGMKRAHPTWGKQRIADEISKANNWVPLVSVNTVREILRERGLWTEQAAGAGKKKAAAVAPKNQGKP